MKKAQRKGEQQQQGLSLRAGSGTRSSGLYMHSKECVNHIHVCAYIFLLSRTVVDVSTSHVAGIQRPVSCVGVHLVGEDAVEFVDDTLRRDSHERLALGEERPDDGKQGPPVVPQRDSVVVRAVDKRPAVLEHPERGLCALLQSTPVDLEPVNSLERIRPLDGLNERSVEQTNNDGDNAFCASIFFDVVYLTWSMVSG